MGLLDRGGRSDRRTDGGVVRLRMRERAFDLGDDFWVEDDQGRRVYKVDGKVLRVRSTFVLEDPSGREVATIRERLLAVRESMTIDLGGRRAVVRKALLGLRTRFRIDTGDGQDLVAQGNFRHHEYAIERDGRTVARVSKAWFTLRDTYGIEVAPGVDPALIVAITVCIDELAHDADQPND